VGRIPWSVRVVAAAATLGILLASVPTGRHALLRGAGWSLVADDPLRAADVVVIAVDAKDAGVVEAADLVRRGVSHKVALFADVPDEVDRELAKRGIGYEGRATRQTRLLRALGVGDVEQIALPIAGTEDEGRVFPAWCDERRLRSVIVVTSADHTRRLRRVFHRAMKGHPTAVMIRRARYSDFDPDRWWYRRDGIRTGIVELEKLLLDLVRHPIS
jgi:hypothetical protein